MAHSAWPLAHPCSSCVVAVWRCSIGTARVATSAQWRWVTPGGLIAAVLVVVVLDPVFLVRLEFRELQRDLWVLGRRDRLHDLDLAPPS